MNRPVPYRGEVDAALADGRYPDVIVFTGPRAHEQAERRRIEYGPGTALVLSEGTSPGHYDWPPVKPLAVLCDQCNRMHAIAMKSAITALCTRTASDR